MQFAFARGVTVGLAVLAWGCSSSNGRTCHTAQGAVTCPGGTLCINEACVPACATSDICAASESCVDGVCQRVNFECTEDSQCLAPGPCQAAARAYCRDGLCHFDCLTVDGEPCTADQVCASGHCECQDRTCSQRLCSAAICNCKFNTDGDPNCDGSLDPELDDSHDSCGPDRTCNGLGACHQSLGEACWTDDQCESAHCADSVCCDKACDGNCDHCASTDGICTGVLAECSGDCPQCVATATGYACAADEALCPASGATLCTRCTGSSTTFACTFDEALAECAPSYECEAAGVCRPAAERVSPASDSADTPRIGIDANGNALVVWQRTLPSPDEIWGSRFASGSGWSSPTAVVTSTAPQSARQPEIAVNSSGEALAVCQRYDGSGNNIILTNRYAGASWGTAVSSSSGTACAGYPEVDISDDSSAMVVWSQYDCTTYVNGTVARRHSGTAWATAATIDSGSNSVHSDSPTVAMDANGSAIAVWTQDNGSGTPYLWRRRHSGSAWETAATITTVRSDCPQVAMDPVGNAIVVWKQGSYPIQVWATRYSTAGGWTGSTEEIDGAHDGDCPKIAASSGGTMAAAWNSSGTVWTNIWLPASGWGAPTATNLGGAQDAPAVGIDAAGNIIVAWLELDVNSVSHVWASRYAAGVGWGSPRLVEGEPGYAEKLHLAMNGAGQAIMVWIEGDQVWANRLEF
jgi:hypothetical protein